MQLLYYLLIYPIELILELVFSIAYRAVQNPGLSIIAVSIVMNFMIMPMYKKSDELQEKEREKQKEMEPWIKHIRRTFSGDERFMILQTYYRENNYKPIYSFRGSLSLILQIPFFIAAYHFLSHLSLLQGMSFGPIADLSVPDGVWKLAGMQVNILPFIMTAANFISCAIYSKGFILKEKIQLYGMAVIFLVLLYQSPAGLVLYWTCNNLFSLGKNIIMKRLPAENKDETEAEKVRKKTAEEVISDRRIFFLSAIILSVLTGAVIPSSVISASPSEFVNVVDYVNPLKNVVYSLCISSGLFLVWGGTLYLMFEEKTKVLIEKIYFGAAVLALIHFMVFDKTLGNLSAELVYDNLPSFAGKEIAASWCLVAAMVSVILFFWNRGRRIFWIAALALIVSTCAVFIQNALNTNRQLAEMDYIQDTSRNQDPEDKILHLSKTGENVIVIMLDRAINRYIPFIFEEHPQLKQQFDGFVYYPRTISFGPTTNYGVPAFYGGYEYTPAEMNRRKDLSLREKHNEALKLMPALFAEEGYEVTVCDPAYAGYQNVPDLSIFDDMEGVHAYNTMGHYNQNSNQYVRRERIRRRNLFCYSIFRILPVGLQGSFYDEGNYFGTEGIESDYNLYYEEAYSVLSLLPQLTDIREDSDKCLITLDNETPHRPCRLQLPDYTEAEHVDNSQYMDEWLSRFKDENGNWLINMEADNGINEYFVLTSSLLKVGEWFEYLQEQGIYDNTKIIIAADHGYPLAQFEDMLYPGMNGVVGTAGIETLDLQSFNPLLMVKDFNARGFHTNDEVMTNADVPSLAFQGIIENPVNPATGKPVTMDGKKEPLYITTSNNWSVQENNGNTYVTIAPEFGKASSWYKVTGDDPFNIENWQDIGTESPE